MNPQKTSFTDPLTIGAMVLMVVFFLGWQRYMQTKYPEAYAKKSAAQQTAAPGASDAPSATDANKDAAANNATTGGVSKNAALAMQAKPTGSGTSAPTAESLVPVKTETMAFDLTSKGMGLRNLHLVKYRDRRGETVDMGLTTAKSTLLETKLMNLDTDLDFKIEKQSENVYVGHAVYGGVQLTKMMELDPERYLIKFKVAASGSDPKFTGLTTTLIEQLDSPTKGNLLLPQLEKQEFFIETNEKNERTAFKKEDFNKGWDKVKLASIGSQYFTQAIIDNSPVMPEAKVELKHGDDRASVWLRYAVLNAGQDFQLDYQAYVGPKSYGLLRSIDPTLAGVVDFGFFHFIARHIFDLLKFFYSLVGNWGFAIVCLTLVVRACLLPFNVYSYRSMRAMQAIQPKIAAVKERYKNDPQKANAEVMGLMRENRVNPLGGCLPILLQFPIFFALYQMLGHTIELYQAPFGLWINDLSLKDPYYVLPVLMGITMFIQQKTTPNASMDPNQAKILMMMPLIFTFFMISLPSGLALYMLVGAVFSVVQQTVFMKLHKTPGGLATQ